MWLHTPLNHEAAPVRVVSPSHGPTRMGQAECLSCALGRVRGLGYSKRVRNQLRLQGHSVEPLTCILHLHPVSLQPARKPDSSDFSPLFLRPAALVTLMCLFQFSKKILTLGLNQDPPPHPNTLRLQKMIRYSATLFVQVKPILG